IRLRSAHLSSRPSSSTSTLKLDARSHIAAPCANSTRYRRTNRRVGSTPSPFRLQWGISGIRDPLLNFRPLFTFSRLILVVISAPSVVAGAIQLAGQNVATSLLVLSRDGRRALPLTVSGSQEMVGLDDLAAMFQLAVREDRDALTVSYKGRTVVLTPDQSMASVSGRLITLPAPPAKIANRWIVPVEFISRALLPIYDQRLELRRPSRLLIVGDLRVPRVTIRQEQIGTGSRLTIESTPRSTTAVAQDNQRLTAKFAPD